MAKIVTNSYVLALDLGTGSARAVVFDREGQQIATVSKEWFHSSEPGVPGSQVFSTGDNWQVLSSCMRQVLTDAGASAQEIAAVSVTSMREGIVLFDDAGEELWACTNVDARASDQALALVKAGLARRIYERAGDWVSITTPARLWWLRDHEPEVLDRASALGMLSDWALFRLSGRLVTEPSAGSSSGMFDLGSRTWSTEIMEWIGLDPNLLPEVVEPGTVIGRVTEKASAETGLAAGTSVVAAGADTQLALVGLGHAETGTTTVIGGSFWQATSVEDRPVIDPEARLRTLCHTEPGSWMIEGIGFYIGIAMRWFRDAFCEVEKAIAEKEGISAYAAMERSAAAVPAGSGGLLAILSNVMDAKRWVQASPSFLQFTLDSPQPTRRAHCIRAIEESAAFVTRRHIEIIGEVVGRPKNRIRFTGGASQGTLWPQIVADVAGMPVDVPMIKESTALGAAAYAAVGAGWVESATAAFPKAGEIEHTYEPQEASHSAYEAYYQSWLDIYPRMLQLTEEGMLRPMWWPAGVEKPHNLQPLS